MGGGQGGGGGGGWREGDVELGRGGGGGGEQPGGLSGGDPPFESRLPSAFGAPDVLWFPFCVSAASSGMAENLTSVSIGTNAVMAPALCTGVDRT